MQSRFGIVDRKRSTATDHRAAADSRGSADSTDSVLQSKVYTAFCAIFWLSIF